MGRNYFNLNYRMFFILFCVTVSVAQVIEKEGITYKSINDLKIRYHNLTEQNYYPVNNYKLFAEIKNDFMVNTLGGEYGANQQYPDIAIDGNGNYCIVWLDKRNGVNDIYAQFYNNNNEKLGGNILVNEKYISWTNPPVVACNSHGDFVVSWVQSYGKIIGQCFDNKGNKRGDNFQINIKGGDYFPSPALSVNDYGYFTASWMQDTPLGNLGVYVRIFNVFGIPSSVQIQVNDDDKPSNSLGWNKYLAADPYGDFIAVWSSLYDGNSKIFLQKFDSQGNKINDNIIVSDAKKNYYGPAINSTADGYFFIMWNNYFRIYHSEDYFVNNQTRICSDTCQSSDAVMVSVANNGFSVLITENYKGISKIQNFSKSGDFIRGPVLLLTNKGDFISPDNIRSSDIVNNYFHITNNSNKSIDYDVFMQTYDNNIIPINNYNKVNDDLYSSSQINPYVYYNNKGRFIILWQDKRNGRDDLYGQVYDENYNPIGVNIMINDLNEQYWTLHDKSISSFSDGTFLVVFSGSSYNYNNSNIYLQKISSSGKKIGTNKIIKNKVRNCKVKTQIDDQNEIFISWYYNINFVTDAFFRIYDQEFNPISQEEHFIQNRSKIKYNPFSICINKKFNIFVTWVNYSTENRHQEKKIYGLFYDNAGNEISDTLLLDEKTNNYFFYRYLNNIADSLGNYALSWVDEKGIGIKRYYITAEGVSLENSFNSHSDYTVKPRIALFKNNKLFVYWLSAAKVYGCFLNDNIEEKRTYLIYEFNELTYPLSYNGNVNFLELFNNDKIFFTYESNKNGGTGYDIWANVQELKNIDFDEEMFRAPVEEDFLYQNFPNPFNPKTKIAYKVFSYHRVKIVLYNVLGEEVKILVDKPQEKGYYEIELDASNLPSGVYFCRLQAFNTKVIKMLLVK